MAQTANRSSRILPAGKVGLVPTGYCWPVKKNVEIEIDTDLVDDAIHRFHLANAPEAVNLALRTLLHGTDPRDHDEFS